MATPATATRSCSTWCRSCSRFYRRPTSDLARLEAALLVLARQLDAHGALAQLPDALRQLLDSLLPAQLEERARAGERERGHELVRKHDGSGWRIRGDLDLETGEAAFTVLFCTGCHSGVHHGSTITLKDGRHLGPDGWIE